MLVVTQGGIGSAAGFLPEFTVNIRYRMVNRVGLAARSAAPTQWRESVFVVAVADRAPMVEDVSRRQGTLWEGPGGSSP